MEAERSPPYRLTMCNGVIYLEGRQAKRCHFTQPQAALPVVLRGNGVAPITWGRREGEGGRLPLGGWAQLSAIRAQAWDSWQPRPVRLLLQGFMEQDIQGRGHWFTLTSGQWVQGLLARHDREQRVYVVTLQPEIPGALYPRWPRIVSA